jgi:hypothetical protein
MCALRDDIVAVEVPDQGHAPLLADRDIIGRIGAFVAGCESEPGIDDSKKPRRKGPPGSLMEARE